MARINNPPQDRTQELAHSTETESKQKAQQAQGAYVGLAQTVATQGMGAAGKAGGGGAAASTAGTTPPTDAGAKTAVV